MEDNSKPTAKQRVTLSSKQVAEGLGRELCELTNQFLADGNLDESEVTQLKTWLGKCPDDSIPAICFIRDEIRRYLAYGQLYPWQLGRIQLSLERILPASDRALAKQARMKRESSMEAAEAMEKQEQIENRRVAWENIRAIHREDLSNGLASLAQVKYIEDLGGKLNSNATKQTASELIDRLLVERENQESETPQKSPRIDRDAKLKKAVAEHSPQAGQKTLQFTIPGRQPYEGKATLKQKDFLWSLGLRDQAVIDSLGKWQASALIDQLQQQQSKSGAGCLGMVFLAVIIIVVILYARVK